MRLFPQDRRFEEAGRNPELCDKLLKDLQRARKLGFVLFVTLGVALMATAAWLLVLLIPAIKAIGNGTPYSLVVDWLLAHKGIFWCSSPLFVSLAHIYVQTTAFDTQVKMLLFLRAQQNCPS